MSEGRGVARQGAGRPRPRGAAGCCRRRRAPDAAGVRRSPGEPRRVGARLRCADGVQDDREGETREEFDKFTLCRY